MARMRWGGPPGSSEWDYDRVRIQMDGHRIIVTPVGEPVTGHDERAWQELRAAAQDVWDNADLDSSPRSFTRLEAALTATANEAWLDVDRLAKVAIEPYEDDPTRGRCRVCGEDGQTVGVIEEPEALAAAYARVSRGAADAMNERLG